MPQCEYWTSDYTGSAGRIQSAGIGIDVRRQRKKSKRLRHILWFCATAFSPPSLILPDTLKWIVLAGKFLAGAEFNRPVLFDVAAPKHL
jgi:hypothetical protein